MHAHELQSDAFYTEHFTTLVETAVSRFHVPMDDAVELVHQLLLACLCQARRIDDPKVWLAGALQCAVQKRGHHA
jgi:hypothetical protein